MYFLYRHIRDDKNIPFYIGIGTTVDTAKFLESVYRRAYKKRDRNEHWKRIVSKTNYSVDILYETSNRVEIQQKEMEFISLYKRTVDGGSLCNQTYGDKDLSGYRFGEDHKRKLSDKKICRKLSKEHIEKIKKNARVWNKGVKGCFDADTIKKITLASTGKVGSQKQKEAVRKFLLENNPMKNTETRLLISKLRSGGNSSSAKSVKDLNTGITYQTINEFAEANGMKRYVASRQLGGKTKRKTINAEFI
jgi:hypothetical protein